MDTVRVYIQQEEGGDYLPYDVLESHIQNDENGCSVVLFDKRYELSPDINKREDIYGHASFDYDDTNEETIVLIHVYGEDEVEDIEPWLEPMVDHCDVSFDDVDPYLRRVHLKAYLDDQFRYMSLFEQNSVLLTFVDAVEEVINEKIARYGGRQRTAMADWKLFEQFSIDYPELFTFNTLISQDGDAYGRIRDHHSANLSAMQSYWAAGMEMSIEDKACINDKWRIDKWKGVTISGTVHSRYYSRIFIKIDEKSPMCDLQLCHMYTSEVEAISRVDIYESLRYLTYLNFNHEDVQWEII